MLTSQLCAAGALTFRGGRGVERRGLIELRAPRASKYRMIRGPWRHLIEAAKPGRLGGNGILGFHINLNVDP